MFRRRRRRVNSTQYSRACHSRSIPHMKPVVGVIGLGIMGSAMAANLVQSGFRVIGHDILPKARRALARTGGVAARSNADVARRAPIVITSLPSVAAMASVAGGIAAARRRDMIVVETGSTPLATKEHGRGV